MNVLKTCWVFSHVASSPSFVPSAAPSSFRGSSRLHGLLSLAHTSPCRCSTQKPEPFQLSFAAVTEPTHDLTNNKTLVETVHPVDVVGARCSHQQKYGVRPWSLLPASPPCPSPTPPPHYLLHPTTLASY